MNCSFCQKSKDAVRILIESSPAYICEECIEVCIGVIHERYPKIENKMIQNLQKEFGKPATSFEELGIRPRFPPVRLARRNNHCFYVCPFSEPFNTIYTDHTKPAAELAGYTVERTDEIYGTEAIIDDIWQA